MAVRIPYIPYNPDTAEVFEHLNVSINTQEVAGKRYWDPNEYANWLDEAQYNAWEVDDGETWYKKLPTRFSYIYWSVEGHCWY